MISLSFFDGFCAISAWPVTHARKMEKRPSSPTSEPLTAIFAASASAIFDWFNLMPIALAHSLFFSSIAVRAWANGE